MSIHKLIMPKQTGQLDALIASLKLFYESYNNHEEWYSNEDFKINIQKELPYLSEGAKNGPYLVKQSELARYFGLVDYDYTVHVGRARITPKGISFYKAWLENQNNILIDIIMESIFTLSFGRNNTAIKSSDSDIDPPKLFIKAIFDLHGITRKDLAYLLYVTHDLKINYSDAIIELSKTNDIDREIPLSVANKYSDTKFTVLLTLLGITNQDSEGKYFLSQYVLDRYVNDIKNLSIYNKEPEVSLTLKEEDDDEFFESIDFENKLKERILVSYVYDIHSERFHNQNNRVPQSYRKGNSIRYKTNSRIAKTAIDLSEYKCLSNKEHLTFISKLGKPYMEAHHLIPMAAQKDFQVNIDRIENIVSLCPICHSAIHLGDESLRLELVKNIYDIKQAELRDAGIIISFGELFSKYYK